jgi:hypothetical protein
MAQRLSQLASELWPLLLPKVTAMVGNQGTSSGTSGGGTVGLHDLSGTLHRGTLADAQAPQFLMSNGSRALTGDLAVDAGIMLDGVDLSAHAVDVNAHHNKQHGIVDSANHTATGSQYQVVGLTATNTIGLLTPSSSPGANALIKTDGSSAITLTGLLYADGGIDFGTNVLDEDATYLQFTGSKAIRFGQNIGNANWTVYNTGAADFNGTVNVKSGGDLYVAGSGAYAGNDVIHASAVGGNVGILCVADSQFALDVNGPARATYFIGPHALQLKGVLLLAHYDGRAPYETNYTGEVNGHMGQVGTVAGSVIFRPGKFYKAAQVAVSTTNLIGNPSFEVDTSGWSCTSGIATRTAANSIYGQYSIKLDAAAGGGTGVLLGPTINVTSGVTYTLSAWFYLVSGTSIRMDLNDKSYEVEQVLTASNVWTRLVMTFTPNATGTINPRFYSTTNAIAYIDGVQLEQKNFATPYCDGTLGGYNGSGVPDGSGHVWSGTAHASTSNRTSASISYPVAGNLNGAQGTIAAWVWVDGHDGAGNEGILDAGAAWAYFAFWMNNGITPSAVIGNASGYVQANGPTAALRGWVHAAMTWANGSFTVYTNGIAGAPVSYTNAPVFSSTFSVGYLKTLGGDYLNGMIDDLCILDRAAPATEIRAIYESNAPVFAETSNFSFRPTPKGLIWADDNGLWMRDTAGNNVLGIYGGEAATYPWGGFTMEAGDIVFGRNAAGSSAIWWNQNVGTFGFYGNGNGTPQVEIATDGSLTAGAGKVKLDSTGFHAFNASAASTIDIDANGISTGDGGARTTIATWISGSRIKWYSVGELYAATPEAYLDDSSVSRTLYPLVVRAMRVGNDAALIELAAVKSSDGTGAKITIGDGFRLKDYFDGSGTAWKTNRVVHAKADDIIFESTNVQFSGQTTSASAVGSYAGKIKIRINGTDRYIPYYAS